MLLPLKFSLKTRRLGWYVPIVLLLRVLVSQLTAQFQQDDIHRLFAEDSFAAGIFSNQLKRLIKVLKPFAKTIASLESSQANPADVYLFWLAILSNLKHVLDNGDTGFTTREAGQIRAVANGRFRELLTEGPDDCFISAFYLDPRTSLYFLTVVYVLS